MNKLNIFKSATGLVFSAGAGAVVSNAIKATTPIELSTYNKVLIGVGSFAMTGIAGAAASKYVTDQIDEMAEKIRESKNSTEEDN